MPYTLQLVFFEKFTTSFGHSTSLDLVHCSVVSCSNTKAIRMNNMLPIKDESEVSTNVILGFMNQAKFFHKSSILMFLEV